MTLSVTALDAFAVQPPPPIPELPWRLFVAETTTGKIIRDLPFVGAPQWSYGLNMAGGLSAKIPIGAISKDELRAVLDYWRLSIGIAWGDHIWQCGPVVTYRFTDVEGPPVLDVGAAGIWGLFSQKRVIANPAWTGVNLAAEDADVNLTNLSLHTIAKRLVQNDLTRNGSIPIVLPSDIAGSQERAYPGYDLAYVGERLSNLTQVINGPEIEFRPEYTDDSRTYMQWRMRIGNPRLGNLGLPHSWDYGRALSHVDEDGDGSNMQFASWVRGNGMERGLLIGHYTDETLVDLGWPMLESVDGSHTSAVDQNTLDGWAQANVETYRNGMNTWAARVRIDGTDGRDRRTGSPALDIVSVGDNAVFNMSDHRWIPDGAYGQRILSISSGGDLVTAQLALQGT